MAALFICGISTLGANFSIFNCFPLKKYRLQPPYESAFKNNFQEEKHDNDLKGKIHEL